MFELVGGERLRAHLGSGAGGTRRDVACTFDPHRFEVVAGWLGLSGRLKHKPSELSGGEQQRVALARAIISEPKIVLADEPTGNLDTKSSEAVLGLLRQLNQDLGQTIVMITHNPEAAAYGHRILHMRDGEVVDGSTVH